MILSSSSSGLLSGVLASLLGKRYASLYGQALSYILGHCLLMSASSVNMLFGGRFLCGLCQGFCNCLTIVYILDLCEDIKVKSLQVCGFFAPINLAPFDRLRQFAGFC